MQDDTYVTWDTQKPRLPKIRDKAVKFLFAWPFVGMLAEVTGLTRWFYGLFGDNPFKSSFTVFAGIVALGVLLLVSCFHSQKMRRFVRTYCITTLVLAVPTALVLVLRAANGGGVLALSARNQWVGDVTGNLYLDAVRSGYYGPAAVRFLFPWLFYNHSLLFLTLGLPIMMQTQILGFPFMVIILLLPPWLAFVLTILIALVMALLAFLPMRVTQWIGKWCKAVWWRIRHRSETEEPGGNGGT